MVRLVHQCLADHLASLYRLSCSHHLVDTVLVCSDGKLYQHRLVVQMMLRLLDLDHESDSDIVIIMPEFSVEDIEVRIQHMFGIKNRQKEEASQIFQENAIDPRDDLIGNYYVDDSYDSYGIPEMLAKLTDSGDSSSSMGNNQTEISPLLNTINTIDVDPDTRPIQTPDFSENLPVIVAKSIDQPLSKSYKNSKCKSKKKDSVSGLQVKSDRMRDMSKPYKPVKMVYKDRPKNLVCPECSYRTYHISNLTNHIRTHTGEKPFSCQHCGETFRFSGVRNLHERTHTGEKEYSCQYCGKEFARRYVCLLHERTHTGEKPFACDYCGKRFTRHSTKVNHEKSHVGDPSCNFTAIVEENQGTDVYVELV